MNNLEGEQGNPSSMRPVHLLLMLVVLASLSGCLGGGEGDAESTGSYTVESSMTSIELEAKSADYQDEATVEWSVDSSAFSEAIDAAGGNVVGVLFSLTYGEDETSGGPLCTGGEVNAPDTITGGATKGEWTLSGSGENPGSHEVNLTWHNASLLSGVIEGMTKSEIESQLAFGEEALGAYNLAVTVDAEAFDGALCSHNDDGEEVASVVSLLVLDFTVLDEDGEALTTMAVGDGSLHWSCLQGGFSRSFSWWATSPLGNGNVSTSTSISANLKRRSLKANPPRTARRWLTATVPVSLRYQPSMSLKVSPGASSPLRW